MLKFMNESPWLTMFLAVLLTCAILECVHAFLGR
jgi:hypothetical protein